MLNNSVLPLVEIHHEIIKFSQSTENMYFQDTVFLITGINQKEILLINGSSLRIKSQVPAPGMEQGPMGSFVQFHKRGENYILSTAPMEILNGISKTPLLTFVPLFTKLCCFFQSIKSISEIANEGGVAFY